MTIEQIQSIQKQVENIRKVAMELLEDGQIESAQYIHDSCFSIEMEIYSMIPSQLKPKCACTNS